MKWWYVLKSLLAKRLTNAQKAQIIEYWLNNPGMRMKDVGRPFEVSEHTVSNLITRDYFGRSPLNPMTITLQSKLNMDDPEKEL
jgi:hypothetical protein